MSIWQTETRQRDVWTGFDFFKLRPARINRVKYFGLCSFWAVLFFAAIALANSADFITSTNFKLSQILLYIIVILLFISVIINSILLKIRRLHDFNFSGWWILLLLVPLIGQIWPLFILLLPGDERKNKYGEQPKRAALPYKLLSFIGPILSLVLIVLITSNFSSSTELSSWKSASITHHFEKPPNIQKFLDPGL